jgi:hypothetical protein
MEQVAPKVLFTGSDADVLELRKMSWIHIKSVCTFVCIAKEVGMRTFPVQFCGILYQSHLKQVYDEGVKIIFANWKHFLTFKIL